jgi:hypothetical protein
MSGPRYTTDLSSGTAAAVASRGTPATLNLDDIFGDVMFTPDGDTVFLSEEREDGEMLNSGEAEVSMMARKNGVYVQQGGGLNTTNLTDNQKASLVMGSAGAVEPTAAVPYRKAPQASHHLQYAMPKKKPSRSSADRKMSEQQKVERRYVFADFFGEKVPGGSSPLGNATFLV